MRSKLFKLIICTLLAFTLMLGTISASEEGDTKNDNEAQSLIDGIVAFKLQDSGDKNIVQWIDGELTKNAGESSEWYVMGLCQYGLYDFSSYISALKDYLSDNRVSSASSRQKYALTFIGTGSDDEYIYETLNDSIGQQGLMSWVFGLHLLNNGYVSEDYTLSEVKSTLLSMQLGDGGWTITGTDSDVDATAMVIQAIAPYYKTDSQIQVSIDKALKLLSNRQKDTGDYASYGINNAESTAQVLIALSSLGIDCKTDERFIKNGKTIFDGISQYQLEDGSFCHRQGDISNENATAQVFCSMVSYLRMIEGKSALYIFGGEDSKDLTGTPTPVITVEGTTQQATEAKKDKTDSLQVSSEGGYRQWVILAVCIVGAGICAVLLLMKKRKLQNYAIVGIITLFVVVLVLNVDFQSPEEYYDNAEKNKTEVIGTVSLTIRCDSVTDKIEEEYIPEDGVILEKSSYEIESGDTVYDILSEAAAENKIHMETSGSEEAVYVEGINNIYEFDFGDLSGWVYLVNGEEPSMGCGEYVPDDGDKIEWIYRCE